MWSSRRKCHCCGGEVVEGRGTGRSFRDPCCGGEVVEGRGSGRSFRDPLEKFKFVRESFNFGGANDEMKIPVVGLDEDVKRALLSVGNTKLKEWNDNWKAIQVKEIDIFRQKATLLKERATLLSQQARDLLAEMSRP